MTHAEAVKLLKEMKGREGYRADCARIQDQPGYFEGVQNEEALSIAISALEREVKLEQQEELIATCDHDDVTGGECARCGVMVQE